MCSELLSYTKSAVTRNQSEKKINSLLDHVSQSSDMKLLQDFYSITLSSLAETNNERLWFKTQLKLCGLWFKLKEFGRMHKIVKELHRCVYAVLLMGTTCHPWPHFLVTGYKSCHYCLQATLWHS